MCTCCNGELSKVKNYIGETRFIILGTISKGGKTELRTLGSFASDGLTIYFSTGKNSSKVEQIQENPAVTILFQQEGQELSSFRNVTYQGEAQALESSDEFAKGVEFLSARNPRFKERAEKGQLSETIIFKVSPEKIKYLDFATGSGPAAVKEIRF